MKRHFLGLALFSFILSVAATVHSFFNIPAEDRISASRHVLGEVAGCRMKGLKEKATGDAKVKQAILNPVSGFFVFEIGCVENSEQTTLYFYQKNKGNMKLIATEEIELKKSLNCQSGSSLYKNFAWAKDIGWNSDIYFITQTSNRGKKFSPRFDEALAIPVVMAESSGEFTID